jgi:GntR family transcriptional regulator
MVNPGSVVPPWQQIHALLKGRIETGEYPPGTKIPSIMALSQEFSVAPVTARKAVTALQREGLVENRSGWGTFVQED